MSAHLKITIDIDTISDFALQQDPEGEFRYIVGFAKGFATESLRYPDDRSYSKLPDSNGNSVGSVTVERSAEFSDLLRAQGGLYGGRLRAPERIDSTELDRSIHTLEQQEMIRRNRELSDAIAAERERGRS